MDFWRLLPKYWLQNGPTDREWDALLSAAIDRFGVSEIGPYTCTVGGVEIWIKNWPYAFGAKRDELEDGGRMPSVATRKKLRRAIQESRIKALPEAWRSA